MKKVTVVVPVFNAEKYLQQCLDSILKQTSNEFEILIVNDGSSDGSDQIIKDYVAKHSDLIRGIKKKNAGYGSCLDVAIKEINTPYFMVCRPEDSLDHKAVETLLNIASIANADICIGAFMVKKQDQSVQEYNCGYDRDSVNLMVNSVYNIGSSNYTDLFLVNPHAFGKLYAKSVVEGIGFLEHVTSVDTLLYYLSLLKSKKVIYTDEPIAHVFDNEFNKEENSRRFSVVNGKIVVYKSILNQAERIENVEIPSEFYYVMFNAFLSLLDTIGKMECTADQFEETLDYLGTYLKKLVPHENEIIPSYRKYRKTSIVQRITEEALISSRWSELTYSRLCKKMIKEFKPQI